MCHMAAMCYMNVQDPAEIGLLDLLVNHSSLCHASYLPRNTSSPPSLCPHSALRHHVVGVIAEWWCINAEHVLDCHWDLFATSTSNGAPVLHP